MRIIFLIAQSFYKLCSWIRRLTLCPIGKEKAIPKVVGPIGIRRNHVIILAMLHDHKSNFLFRDFMRKNFKFRSIVEKWIKNEFLVFGLLIYKFGESQNFVKCHLNKKPLFEKMTSFCWQIYWVWNDENNNNSNKPDNKFIITQRSSKTLNTKMFMLARNWEHSLWYLKWIL